MEHPLWPSALFAFVFVLMGTLRLARTPKELGWGITAATLLALGVLMFSPTLLIPATLFMVALAWWRDNGTLSKKHPTYPLQHIWKIPSTQKTHHPLLSSFVNGIRIGTTQAHERGLIPWKPTKPTEDTPEEQAQNLIIRAQRSNPFRPEGPLGHRTGIKMEKHPTWNHTDQETHTQPNNSTTKTTNMNANTSVPSPPRTTKNT